MSYSKQYLREPTEILSTLDRALCEKAVELLAAVVSRSRINGGHLGDEGAILRNSCESAELISILA
jgi:hypothetical protein